MDLEKKINEHYHLFNEVDAYIAKTIIQNKERCEVLTIKQFADEIHVSQSALTRFAQKIGLQGYKEIKSIIRIDRLSKTDVSFNNKKEAIENYHKIIKYVQRQDHDELFKKIHQAKRILIFADGFAMSKVASECKRMFLPLAKIVYFIHGHDMTQSFTSLANQDDLVFIFSFKGDTKTVVSLAKDLKLHNIGVVSITQLNTNALAQLCDYNLYVHTLDLPTRETMHFESSTPFYLLIELFIIQYQFFCEHNFNN